jgi:hypothetical protein
VKYVFRKTKVNLKQKEVCDDPRYRNIATLPSSDKAGFGSKKTNVMNYNEAIDFMKESKNVDDWNERREIVKGDIDPEEYPKTIAFIDGSGLITEVLGEDLPPRY